MHPEDYVHRIGRTGRAAAEGDAISFVTPDDEPSVRDLEKMIGRKVARKKVAGFDYSEAPAITSFHHNNSHRAPQQRSSRPPQRQERRRA